jgi:hypothetical protein
LIQNGLLEYLDETKSYRTIEKGLKFPKMYEQMERLTTTERNLPKIQKNGLEEMQGWASKKVKKATMKAKFGIMAAANNQYAGFGPAVLSRENTTRLLA